MNIIDFVKSEFEDLSCHTGITFFVEMRIVDSCTNIPDDLTGYTASLKVFAETAETSSYTISGTISDPTSGIVSFTSTASATSNYVVGMYRHQIELTIGTTVYLAAQGKFEVNR